MPRQKKRPDPIVHMPVGQLMGCLYEQNPREHSWDDDLPKLVKSLLFAGWCELPSWNAENDRVIGGHGRIMACEWLVQQNKNWFEEQWQGYRSTNPQATEADRERFTAGYWLKVPVKVSNLDDRTHAAMVIRLNNPAPRGRSNDELKALILSKLSPVLQDVALPDPEMRSKLLGRIAQYKSETEPQRQEESDRQAETAARLDAALSDFEPAEIPQIEPAAEPDVGEGGAHMVEDPEPGQKRQVRYPLAIVLSDRRYRQLQEWKARQGISSDQAALLKGHEVFRAS